MALYSIAKLYTGFEKAGNALGFVEWDDDGGSELEATDKYLSTPLFVAVQQGQTPVVEYLVSVGADPNTQNYVRVACAPGCHWSHVPALTACVSHHSRA